MATAASNTSQSVGLRNGSASAGSGPIVRFDRVNKAYAVGQPVVRDVSFDVARGEFFTMLGPSGSGKTTSLMMLAGFEDVSSGTIHVAGAPVSNQPAHKRNIGVVFQNYALFPHMSVAENLDYPLSVRKIGRAERQQRVSRALQMVRLDRFGDRRPKQLSGGQQQRVALARALIFEPSIVLLDEPLGALDKQLREEMQGEIRRIQQDLGVTMLYVTHDQSEALTMSDRIAVFRNGAIVQIDTPRSLYERPVDSFVATFVGENNTLAGRVGERSDTHGTLSLACGGTLRLPLAPELSATQAVVAHIRPEDLRIGPSGGNDVVVCNAKLRNLTFNGDHVRVRCDVPGGESLVCKVDKKSVERVEIGSSVPLCCEVENVRVFGAGEG
jgi:putative spermidine/putrescine transport system ATP-binding protein